MKNCLFLLLLLLFPFKGICQQSWEIKFDRLTTEDGLSQGMVNSILQDKYGFMWFASNDGLNRYDGHRFTIYKNDPNDNNSIADNFIRYLFEDSQGRIWIATAGSGLDLFDRETEAFIHFKHSANDSNSISDNSITCVDEDHTGGIWIGTLHGLNRLQISPQKEFNQTGKPSNDATKEFLRNYSVSFSRITLDKKFPDRELYTKDTDFELADWRASNFHVDKNGIIWVSTLGKLYCISLIDSAEYHVENLPLESYMPSSSHATRLGKYVQDFIPGPNQNSFYMLFQYGVTSVNSRTGVVQILSETNMNKGAFAFPNILDNNGNIWTCDENIPSSFNTQTNTWIKLSTDDKNIESILKYISCSYKDKMGNIWLGTKGYGLLKYSPAKNNFNGKENQYIRYMSAGNNENVLFVKDPYDELFWEYDRITNTTKVPVPVSALNNPQFKHFSDYTTAVLQDADSSYWIGRIGLYHYNPVSKKATEYWDKYENVFPLYDDSHGNLWFGNTSGLVEFNKITKTSVEHSFPVKATMGPYDFLQAIYRDKKGILWLGTLAGLYRFNPDKRDWKQYKNIPGDLKSINNNLIFTICPDPLQSENYLWIGTKGGGLNRFDLKEEVFIQYTERHGLSNDVVYGILSDSTGNLWLSTNKGLSNFNIKAKQFKNYNVSDGLQGSEYNRNAFCKSEKGFLYFGGITGFNYFNPAALIASNYVPMVWITGINVLNKALHFGDPNGVLKKPAYLTDHIELKYEQNMISFEFASTDYSAVHNNRFQYQLSGFDNNWIETGINNTATFTNLNPGTYELRVKGSNSNGVWNEKPTLLTITILPPWYLTWWFRISLLFSLIAILYGIHRYRLMKIIQLEKVRNSIASDLHDEIGSNLSAIAVFSDLAGHPQKTAPEVNNLLKKISDYTQTSQDSMSDIVWMIDSKHDRLGALKVRMHSFANEVLESKSIRLRFSSDPTLDDVKLTMQQRKAVYLVFKESIHNILKYASADEVIIELLRENNQVNLSIADNGKGIQKDNYVHKNIKGGNGLENMKKRAESINGMLQVTSTIDVGTKITLIFSAR